MAASHQDEFEHLDIEDFVDLFQNIDDLKQLAANNSDYFAGSPKQKSEQGVDVFEQITAVLAGVELLCKEIAPHVKEYDFNAESKGNGFRSLLSVTNRCLAKLVRLSQRCSKKRDKMTFSSSALFDEVVAYTEVLKCLSRLLLYGVHVLEACKPETSMFPDENALNKELGWDVESLPRVPFYGKCLGFQYCPSMRPLLNTVSIAMAAYGESFRKHGRDRGFVRLAASSVGNSWKYIMNAKQRAEMVVDLTTHCDVQFAKAFWSLTEGTFIRDFPKFVCPSVAVNKTTSLPVEDVVLPHRNDPTEEVKVSPPMDENGEPQPVNVRVIVHKVHRMKGQDEGGRKRTMSTNSEGLLIHFHGGGFVAQSSKSHESYLRDWAHDLGVTILSVDYSLAPEHPFPRGLDDCFFAYAWALANYRSLYTNAKFVCVAGDSAGANLSVAVTLKAIDYGIRLPDGIVSAYGPFLIRYSISPSRLLSVMDPVLHHGILIKCLGAYAGQEQPVELTDAEKEFLVASTSVDPPVTDVLSQLSVNDVVEVFDEDDESGEPLATENDVTDSRDQDEATTQESDFELVQDDGEPKQACAAFQESFTYQASVQMSNAQGFVSNGWTRLKSMVTSTVAGEEAKDQINLPGYDERRRRSAPPLGVKEPSPVVVEPMRHWKSEDLLEKSQGLRPFCHLPVTSNPYMSPYMASDEVLLQLPPIYLIAAHLDPLLDDSIAFAHRLRSLNKWVHLQVVDNVPHGFLCFSVGSKEARQGSDLCVQCIAEVLHVPLKKSKQNPSLHRFTSTSVDTDSKRQSNNASPAVSPLVDIKGGSASVDVLSPPASQTELHVINDLTDQQEDIVPESLPSDDVCVDQSAFDDQNS